MKLLKKTQLGKKRFLGKPNKEPKEIKNEEIIVIGDSINMNQNQEENNASFLLKLILKAYYLSIWKKQVKALKYFSRKTNKQRINFKKLIKEISLVINQHKSKHFNEIIEKIDSMPLPKNILHDKNFGTLKIINKEKNYRSYNNIEEYIEENNINNDIIYEDGSKQMDFNNNDFNENEYNTYENIEEDNFNINKNIEYNNKENYNENEIEEDEAFIENEYDYNQDISNEIYYKNNNINDNINDNNEYYPEDNYYDNNIYDNDEYYYDNNNDIYIENQYHYYYNSPNERQLYPYEERYYEPLNQVNYIKNKGNDILISDIYVKPRIERNQSQYYYYNKNSNNNNINNYYYGYQNNNNINNFRNVNNNRNYKRPFPSFIHNYSFYESK